MCTIINKYKIKTKKYVCTHVLLKTNQLPTSIFAYKYKIKINPNENFSQNFSCNFSEFLYNFIIFSHFLYELEHFSENLHLFIYVNYQIS